MGHNAEPVSVTVDMLWFFYDFYAEVVCFVYLFLLTGCLGDTQFSFRLRQSVGRVSGIWFGEKDAYNREAPLTLHVRHMI